MCLFFYVTNGSKGKVAKLSEIYTELCTYVYKYRCVCVATFMRRKMLKTQNKQNSTYSGRGTSFYDFGTLHIKASIHQILYKSHTAQF